MTDIVDFQYHKSIVPSNLFQKLNPLTCLNTFLASTINKNNTNIYELKISSKKSTYMDVFLHLDIVGLLCQTPGVYIGV